MAERPHRGPGDRDAETLAGIIVADLFTNGQGEHAGRLVMEPEGVSIRLRDLGGWSERGMADRIADILKADLAVRQDAAPDLLEAAIRARGALRTALSDPIDDPARANTIQRRLAELDAAISKARA